MEKTSDGMEGEMPALDPEKKNALKRLADICLSKCLEKENVHNFIENMSDYDGDPEHETTLNYLINFLNENEIFFLLVLDWKVYEEDLAWMIESALRQNFHVIFEAPGNISTNEIYGENLIKLYDKTLRNIGYQFTGIDTDADEFMLLLHPAGDHAEVEQLILLLDYDFIRFV